MCVPLFYAGCCRPEPVGATGGELTRRQLTCSLRSSHRRSMRIEAAYQDEHTRRRRLEAVSLRDLQDALLPLNTGPRPCLEVILYDCDLLWDHSAPILGTRDERHFHQLCKGGPGQGESSR